MAKLKICHLFAICIGFNTLSSSKKKKKSSRQRFWNRPLLTDRATSGAFTNLNYLSLLAHPSLASKQM